MESERWEAVLIIVMCWMILLMQAALLYYQAARIAAETLAMRKWQAIQEQLDSDYFYTDDAVFLLQDDGDGDWELTQISGGHQ